MSFASAANKKGSNCYSNVNLDAVKIPIHMYTVKISIHMYTVYNTAVLFLYYHIYKCTYNQICFWPSNKEQKQRASTNAIKPT